MTATSSFLDSLPEPGEVRAWVEGASRRGRSVKAVPTSIGATGPISSRAAREDRCRRRGVGGLRGVEVDPRHLEPRVRLLAIFADRSRRVVPLHAALPRRLAVAGRSRCGRCSAPSRARRLSAARRSAHRIALFDAVGSLSATCGAFEDLEELLEAEITRRDPHAGGRWRQCAVTYSRQRQEERKLD
jgi:hypothetical protein